MVTAGLADSNGSVYRRVYDSRHLQADCQEPGSAPELYAQQSSMGYLYIYIGRHGGARYCSNAHSICSKLSGNYAKAGMTRQRKAIGAER